MFYQVVSVIIGNDLCDFYDLYTSLSVTFVMYFNGRNKDIYYYYYYYYFYYSWASFFSFIPRTVSHLTSLRIYQSRSRMAVFTIALIWADLTC